MVVGSATHTKTKPMDKKTRKKFIRDLKESVNNTDKSEILSLNHLQQMLIEFEKGKVLSIDDMSEYLMTQLTDDTRHIQKLEKDFRDTSYHMQKFDETFRDMLIKDVLYTHGCLDNNIELLNAIDKFGEYCICVLSNENRYKQIKLIDDANLLSVIGLTALKLKTYVVCDNLNDEWGRKITEYCTTNDNKTIIELLELEYKEKSNQNNIDVCSAMTIQDFGKIIKHIRNNEKFYIYRGFSVMETDMVRSGIKDDGDLFYLQNAGTGMSYSLDENIAYYFCHRSVAGEYIDEDFRDNRYYKTERDWYVPSDKYIDTKTEELKVIRDKKKVKPIVCKYECDPSKIVGYRMGMEKEIMIRPEDLKVIHYEIPHSRKLAEELWNYTNSNCLSPHSLRYAAIANGLTALPTYNDEKSCGFIYAETEKVRVLLEELIDCGKKVDERLKRKVIDAFNRNSVELPESIDPFSLNSGLWEYMQKPTNIKVKPFTHYSTKVDKLIKKVFSGASKGFG